MIDWWGLARNSLWILGLSVCLAALGMVSYRARAEQIHLREAISKPGSQLALASGLLLFCLGTLATSRTWWEGLLSGLLVVIVAGTFIHFWRQEREGS
jgi:protein-S-isoprenylcysteine O-methyltransferase Ste14